MIKGLPAPTRGNRIYYDDTVKGFGCRITAAGARAFVLNYRTTSGRERRYTIGAFPDWRTTAAREAAKRLKLEIRVNGADPVGELQAARGEPTVADLCARYLEEHAIKKRPRSAQEDRDMIRTRVLPALGALKVRDVSFARRRRAAPQDYQGRYAAPRQPRRGAAVEDVFSFHQVAMATRQPMQRR